MPRVSYAIREDPNSIFLLQDAGKIYPQYCQVTSMFRNLIRPEFFRQYMYFAPYTGHNGKYRGDITKLSMSIEDNGYGPANNYVAIIDSEVEFRITPSVIRAISREHMPAWGMKAYLDHFIDRKSGILLFLRVYKVNQSLDPRFYEKGVRGSSHILKLYDEDGVETSVFIDGLQPVISDNKFDYLKDEILHILKVENALLSVYDSSEEGLNSLQERVKADRLIKGTHEKWEATHLNWINDDSAEDDGFDRAQLDYEAIFAEVLKVSPEMAGMIEYARGIQAPRLGEYDYYLKDVREHTDKEAEAVSRLFEMSFRFAIKAALYYHKEHGVELEDAFQEACIGIMKAIQGYHESVAGLFPSYVSMWMRQTLWRNLPPVECNVYIPHHHRNALYKIIWQVVDRLGEETVKSVDYDEFRTKLLELPDFDYKKARRVASYVVPPNSIESIVDDPEEEPLLLDISSPFEDIIKRVDTQKVREAMDTLKERERIVLIERYGFDGPERTLEEVGALLGLTRERVRQIEEKAKSKIVLYYYRNHLITKAQLETYLEVDEKGKAKIKQGKRHKADKKRKRKNHLAQKNLGENAGP